MSGPPAPPCPPTPPAALPLSSSTHAAVATVGHDPWNTFAIGKGPWAPLPPSVFGLGIVAVAGLIGFVAERIRLRANVGRRSDDGSAR